MQRVKRDSIGVRGVVNSFELMVLKTHASCLIYGPLGLLLLFSMFLFSNEIEIAVSGCTQFGWRNEVLNSIIFSSFD